MYFRTLFKPKLAVLLLIFITCLIIYVYYSNKFDSFQSTEWSGERCKSELMSVKYQLNEVTEYKNKIEKLLTDTQEVHKIDKERFKDVMDSCVAMKQQSTICQSQFEDLQSECKRVKEENDKIKLLMPKTHR